jgi:hypothetical protein
MVSIEVPRCPLKSAPSAPVVSDVDAAAPEREMPGRLDRIVMGFRVSPPFG